MNFIYKNFSKKKERKGGTIRKTNKNNSLVLQLIKKNEKKFETTKEI